MNIFGVNSTLFILKDIPTFEGIIGLDFLNKINATIDLKNGKIHHDYGTEDIKFMECRDVNFMKVNNIDVPLPIKDTFLKMLKNRQRAFANPDESLPHNTNIVATIRTQDNEPVYSKLYPYPMGVADFVNCEIKELLANGIIRPSRSPHNSPVWVVDKKGVDEMGNRKKHLVIDFRKLNAKTIDDKYPMPNIPMILSNLRKANYFTTLDLKSGFHQIEL